MEKKNIAEKIDWFFNKLLPKKFIVVTIATIIVFLKINPPQEYWWLLLGYFGVNAAQKFTPFGNNGNGK